MCEGALLARVLKRGFWLWFWTCKVSLLLKVYILRDERILYCKITSN